MMNPRCRSLAIAFVVFCLLVHHHDEARADGAPQRQNALLVLRPLISTTERVPADLIYASVLAGLHDSLQRHAAERPDPRRFVEVFTEQSMTGEQAQHIAPIVLFASYTSKRLDAVLKERFDQAPQFQLAMLLEITITELSPANFEIELRLSNTRWKPISEKRIGGCNETIDELAASVREVAARLNSSEPASPAPAARIDLVPPTDARMFIVGTRITLDSCGVSDPSGKKLEVTWDSDVLPGPSHRRRISLLLDRPQEFTVSQTIDGGLPVTTKITVIAPPRADPIVEMVASSNPMARLLLHPDTAEFARQIASAGSQGAPGRASVDPVEKSYAIQMTGLGAVRGHASEQRDSNAPMSSAGANAPLRSSPYVQVVRLYAGKNTIWLTARGIQPNQTVEWHQLSGTHIDLDPCKPVQSFDLNTAQSGYYVFRLVVTAGDRTDEARLSFLAVPRIHADTRHKAMSAKVGESLLLDGTGSYDVLGDQISYTWVVNSAHSGRSASVVNPDSISDDAIDLRARIIDNHAAQPRFIADRAGSYRVTLYMRVVRKIDDVSIIDFDTSETTIEAVDSNHQIFFDMYKASTTRSIGHLGYVYQSPIESVSTVAPRFVLRRLYGGSVGLGSGGDWLVEGMLGVSLRAYDTIQLDLMARLYSRQEQTEDHEVMVGSGANMSLRLWHGVNLWLQLKFEVGFTPLFNPQAQGRFEVVPGVGLAYGC